MRRIKLHRRASQYLQRMPRDRQVQMVAALEEVARYPDINTHLGIRKFTAQGGWFRLRVGVYRAILKPQESGEVEVLLVDYIGPRGDAYKG
jgi:mRNA-degrading endonuclease RelE of RelBE toxin-antitoxin system